jgi:hypothetical protein
MDSATFGWDPTGSVFNHIGSDGISPCSDIISKSSDMRTGITGDSVLSTSDPAFWGGTGHPSVGMDKITVDVFTAWWDKNFNVDTSDWMETVQVGYFFVSNSVPVLSNFNVSSLDM